MCGLSWNENSVYCILLSVFLFCPLLMELMGIYIHGLFFLSVIFFFRLIEIPFGSVEIILGVAVYFGTFRLQTPTCLHCRQLEPD
jgi:hypothetical protein